MDRKTACALIVLFFLLSFSISEAVKLPGAEEEYTNLYDAISEVTEAEIASQWDDSIDRKASQDKWPGLGFGVDEGSGDLIGMENSTTPHFDTNPWNWEPPQWYFPDPDTGQYVAGPYGPSTGWFICSNQSCPDESECEDDFWWETGDANAIVYDVQCDNGAECWIYPGARIRVYVPAVEDLSVVRVSYKKTIPNYSGPPATCSKDVLIRCPEPCECPPSGMPLDWYIDYKPYILSQASGSNYILSVDNTGDDTPSCGPWVWSIQGSGWKLSHHKTYLSLEPITLIRTSSDAGCVVVTVRDICENISSENINCCDCASSYKPTITQSGVTMGQNESVTVSASSTVGQDPSCGPWSWSLHASYDGDDGATLSGTTTYSEGETITVDTDGSACGMILVYATDSCGNVGSAWIKIAADSGYNTIITNCTYSVGSSANCTVYSDNLRYQYYVQFGNTANTNTLAVCTKPSTDPKYECDKTCDEYYFDNEESHCDPDRFKCCFESGGNPCHPHYVDADGLCNGSSSPRSYVSIWRKREWTCNP